MPRCICRRGSNEGAGDAKEIHLQGAECGHQRLLRWVKTWARIVWKCVSWTVAVSKIPVAVKKIRSDSDQGEKEFMAEVSITGLLRHGNLIQGAVKIPPKENTCSCMS